MNSRYKAAIAALCLCIAMAGCGTSDKTSNSDTTSGSSQTSVSGDSQTSSSGKETDTSESVPNDNADGDITEYTLSENDTAEQIADKLEKKYGIDIVYGEDIRTRFDEHGEDLRAEKYTDESGIKTAMMSVDEALGIFPHGLTKQLTSEDKSPLRIYLTGAVSQGDNAAESGGFPAFTDNEDKERYLTIDISLNGEINVPTVCLELTHIIDFTLHDMGAFDDSKWDSLNPEGFSYTEDYENYRSSKFADEYSYTSEHYAARTQSQSADDVYFYYNYSLVNAYEDRATLMEDLIVYQMWDYEIAPDIYSCPHIYDKAKYFLDCIKSAFELGDDDAKKWEDTLDKLSSGGVEN